MKKIQSIIYPALALLALVSSCTKAELSENQPAAEGEKQIIMATVNADTKVNYYENGTAGTAGLKSSWQTGDFFYAIQDGSKVVQFTLFSGAGLTSAVFRAETSGVTESTSWVAVLGGAAKPAGGSEIHCGYMGQSGKLAGLGFYNYVKATGTGTAPSFNFEAGTKLSYILRIALPAGVKCIEYTPCAYQKVTSSSTSTQYFNSSNQNDYSAKNTSTITLSATSSSGDFVYISVPALNFSHTLDVWNSGKQYGNLKTGIVITLLNDTSANADHSWGTVISEDLREKGGKIATVNMSAITLINRAKPSEAVTLTSSSTVFDKQYASNDKILQHANSLTTHWAPYNIGASSATELGDFYAFSECAPKSVYTFVSFVYRGKPNGTNIYYDSIGAQITEGTSTFYTIAGSRYDTARVLWGSAWRMPYWIEYRAIDPISSTTTKSGVKGVTFTQNTSEIFIPMTTLKNGDAADSATYYCTWTTDKPSRAQGLANYAKAFVFGCDSNKTADGSTTVVDYFGREMKSGLPVRAVLASSEIDWY